MSLMGIIGDVPLTIRTGDTEQVTLFIKDSAGAAVNITGRTYAAQIRKSVTDATPIATFTCTITDAAAGKMIATLSATTTAALSPGNACWDLSETNGSVVTTLIGGFVSIVKDVTR